MDKNQQQHLSNFKVYIQGLGEIKRDLEELKSKNITEAERLYQEVASLHAKHSTKCHAASGHYGAGKLHELSGCSSSLNEYKKLVDELYNLKHELLKKFQATQCQFCQKKNLTNPYIGYQKVFCNVDCFNKWNEKQNQYTCQWCKQSKSGQYWYLKEAKNRNKFCSEVCLNYWKDSQKEETKQKTCIGSNCSNKLTKNETAYCSVCLRKNEQALKNLEKSAQETRDLVKNFQNKLICQHANIVYEENKPYFWFCQDCDDDSSPLFISKLQEDLVKDLENDWFAKHNLTASELKTSSAQFTKLSQREFTNQQQISQAYQAIEWELRELVSSIGVNQVNNDKNGNMNSRERSNSTPKSKIVIYWSLVLGGLTLVGIIVYFFAKKNK